MLEEFVVVVGIGEVTLGCNVPSKDAFLSGRALILVGDKNVASTNVALSVDADDRLVRESLLCVCVGDVHVVVTREAVLVVVVDAVK